MQIDGGFWILIVNCWKTCFRGYQYSVDLQGKIFSEQPFHHKAGEWLMVYFSWIRTDFIHHQLSFLMWFGIMSETKSPLENVQHTEHYYRFKVSILQYTEAVPGRGWHFCALYKLAVRPGFICYFMMADRLIEMPAFWHQSVLQRSCLQQG